MRPGEDSLSTTWLEYFAGTRREQIDGAVRTMGASQLEIKPKSGFAIGMSATSPPSPRLRAIQSAFCTNLRTTIRPMLPCGADRVMM